MSLPASVTSPRGFRVLIGGASGMLGKALSASLSVPTVANHFHPEVYSLVRRRPANDREIQWDPYEGRIDVERLEGFDAFVNLAGENIGTGDGLLSFTGRWTDRKKHLILESRRRSSSLLANVAAALKVPPRVVVGASGVGFYGSGLDGAAPVDEDAPKGTGFLSDVCEVTEGAYRPAVAAGIRTVMLRLAPVLSSQGGMLEKMVPPFRLGLGGPLGSGRQVLSFVSLEDAVRAIEFAIRREDLVGPVNVCSPAPVSNAEFTAALGRALGRPAFFTLPAPVLRALFGEMGEETMLASLRVQPARLITAGFRFSHPDVETALRAALV